MKPLWSGAKGAGVDFLPVTWGFGFDRENTRDRLRAESPSDIMEYLNGGNNR